MLTDIDYLCWAAAQGTLEQVKPADLPSFRGMPVPTHLQQQAAQHSTEKLAAAPGGYGAWYSAPAYAGPRRRSGWKAALVALIVLLGLGFVTAMAFGAGAKMQQKRQAQEFTAEDRLATRLPAENAELKPLYEDIDYRLQHGIHTENANYRQPVSRVDLVPSLVRGVNDVTSDWQMAILADMRKRRVNNPGVLFGDREVLFLSMEKDEQDLELAKGIELEFQLEAARQNLRTPAYSKEEIKKIRDTASGITDKLALHREIGARYADLGRVPVFIALFTIEHNRGDLVHVRVLYPGREYRASIPFGEQDSTGPEKEKSAVTPGITRKD
jgi:hypothetical protein